MVKEIANDRLEIDASEEDVIQVNKAEYLEMKEELEKAKAKKSAFWSQVSASAAEIILSGVGVPVTKFLTEKVLEKFNKK